MCGGFHFSAFLQQILMKLPGNLADFEVFQIRTGFGIHKSAYYGRHPMTSHKIIRFISYFR